MNWYVKRAGQALFTLWSVVTLAFVLTRRIPGSAVDSEVARILEQNPTLDREVARERLVSDLIVNPDAPLLDSYISFLVHLAQGDLGRSIIVGDLNAMVADRLPWTLFVMALATFGLFASALTVGAIMAYKEGSYFDLANTGIGMVTTSVPYYIAGLLMVIYIGYGDGIITQHLPPRNRYDPGTDPSWTFDFALDALSHAILPSLAFIVTAYGLLAISMRANSIQVLGEDYVRVAELRGLPSRRIALRYVGRNAILPMYTSLLLSIGFMLGGSVVLEQVFTYQGLGYQIDRGLSRSDQPLLMAVFLIITACVVISTFIADVTYSMLDPRIKSGDDSESY